MALFKVNRGNSSNLPVVMTDGWAYFCTDTAEFFIDYTDDSGILCRKQINAEEAKKITGYDIATVLTESEIEIPTSKAVLDALSTKVNKDNALEICKKGGIIDSLEEDYWESIAYGNGKYVIVSDDHNVSYSTDLMSWTRAELPVDYIEAHGVLFGNGVFVVYPYSGSEILYSTDGVNWSATEIPVNAAWYAGIYADGKFVISSCNSYTSLIHSTDGINWQVETLPRSNSWKSIAYGAGKFVIGGKNGILYSTDLATWTEVPLPVEISVSSITYGNGKFVTSGYGTNYAYSEDGITWNHGTFPTDINFEYITFGNGIFLAVCYWDSIAMRSADGINWESVSLPFEARWSEATYVDDKFILLAYETTTLIYTNDAIHWGFCILKNGEDATVDVANAITPYLTKDEIPTEGSFNVLSSGAIYNAFYRSVNYIDVRIGEKDDGTLYLISYSTPLFDVILEDVQNKHRHVGIMACSRNYDKGTLYIPFVLDNVRYISNTLTAIFKGKYNDCDYIFTYTHNEDTDSRSLKLSGPFSSFVQSDWNETDETSLSYIKNKPEIATDDEIIEMLAQEDMLPVVADADGGILADENENILLW